MGGSHQSSSTTAISNQHEDIHNTMDASVHLDNNHGVNDIDVGNVGMGTTIYNLQNLQAQQMQLQSVKTQLQNLGANAVYHPESNSLVLLV